jgi:hypothetical protein
MIEFDNHHGSVGPHPPRRKKTSVYGGLSFSKDHAGSCPDQRSGSLVRTAKSIFSDGIKAAILSFE